MGHIYEYYGGGGGTVTVTILNKLEVHWTELKNIFWMACSLLTLVAKMLQKQTKFHLRSSVYYLCLSSPQVVAVSELVKTCEI